MKNNIKYDHCDGYSVVREREQLYGVPYRYYSFPELANGYTEFLNEGLVATYPFNKLISEIEKAIGTCHKVKQPPFFYDDDPSKIMWIDGESEFNSPVLDGILRIRFPKYKNAENYDKIINHLKHVLDAFGYFISSYDENRQIISIESKFGRNVTNDIKEHNDFLYHLTPRMYLDKIAKIGLCPMSKNVYNFPSRIYLFTDSILDKYVSFAKELYMKKPKFYDIILGNTDEYDKYVEHGVDPKGYSILKVSVDGIKSPIYIDPNFSPLMGLTALYTEGNIAPKYVEFVDIFSVSTSISTDNIF